VRPVRPVPICHILLRQVRPETLAYTGFHLDTSNQATLPPDLNLNTIADQDSPLPLILLSAFFVLYYRSPDVNKVYFLAKKIELVLAPDEKAIILFILNLR